MEFPVKREWWQHNGGYGVKALGYAPPRFIIEDVVIKDPEWSSWIIYSNDDNCDYFVTTFDEFKDEWTLAERQYSRFDPIHGEHRLSDGT